MVHPLLTNSLELGITFFLHKGLSTEDQFGKQDMPKGPKYR